MKSAMRKLLVVVLAAAPAFTFAHPGHGHGNPLSPDHYLGNPEHSIPIALTLAAVAFVAIWQWKKATPKK